MAGALFIAVGGRSTSASAATISPAKPTVLGQNGLLLCVVTSKNNATHACATSGWAQVGTQVNSGASFTASIWRAAESAVAPTITWTSAAACSAQIAYYGDPANVVDTAIGATTSNTGATATHTSGPMLTTRADSLIVYIDVAAANTALVAPAGWTEDVDAGSATDAGRTVWGNKPVATLGASSGAISVTGAAAAWVQFQIEIRGQLGIPNALELSKAEAGVWTEPPHNQLAVAKMEAGAWLVPDDNQLRFSKAEVGLWLEYSGGRRRSWVVCN